MPSETAADIIAARIAAEIWDEHFASIFAEVERQIAELNNLVNPFE